MSTLGLVLLIVLIIVLLGGLTGPVRQNWGYFPSGGAGLIIVILLILLLTGRI